jgi:hypothetical protein
LGGGTAVRVTQQVDRIEAEIPSQPVDIVCHRGAAHTHLHERRSQIMRDVVPDAPSLRVDGLAEHGIGRPRHFGHPAGTATRRRRTDWPAGGQEL